MRTTFSRQFAFTASLILCSLLLVALAFQPLLRSYLIQTTEQSLRANAGAVANLAAAYDTAGELEHNWDFRISLDLAAQVSGSDALVADPTGEVILCTCGELHCQHLGQMLPEELVIAALQDSAVFSTEHLDGLYDAGRHLVAQKIVSATSENTIGIVVASSQLVQISELLSQTFNIFLFCGITVLLLALVASSILASRQTKPLRDIADTAVRFGRGELDLRVPTGGRNTEEVDDLAYAFNSMAENIAQSEARRSEFVANVSHELRTPMTTIAGFMDGMLDGTIPESEHRKYMQAVSDEVRRLSRLVRDMLDVSRLKAEEKGPIHWQVFDLCEQLGLGLLSFEQRINEKNLQVDVLLPDAGCNVLANQDAITQVIRNLLDNAVKFTPEGGTLILSLKPEGDKAFATVSNTGETIPPEELNLIFDRFHKTDKSRSMDREGVGLGLYIVKSILDEHGEDIAVQSENGLTSFSFTLPLA